MPSSSGGGGGETSKNDTTKPAAKSPTNNPSTKKQKTPPLSSSSEKPKSNDNGDAPLEQPCKRPKLASPPPCCRCTRHQTCTRTTNSKKSFACACKLANRKCVSCACFDTKCQQKAVLPPPPDKKKHHEQSTTSAGEAEEQSDDAGSTASTQGEESPPQRDDASATGAAAATSPATASPATTPTTPDDITDSATTTGLLTQPLSQDGMPAPSLIFHETGADLPGVLPTPADEMLRTVYGDYPHQNPGTHLTGGIQDDDLWQQYHKKLVLQVLPHHYELPPNCSQSK